MFPMRLGKKDAKWRSRLNAAFEQRLLFSVLLIGLPSSAFACFLLWKTSYSLDHKVEFTALILFLWLRLSFASRSLVVNSIRVLSNVVAALKEDDFSFRATRVLPGDVLGELAIEINNLAVALERERIGTMEAVILLRQVMGEVGAAILAFSSSGELRLVNRAAATLLGFSEANLINRKARDIGIDSLRHGPAYETASFAFLGAGRRWIVRRTTFRLRGVPHQLVVLAEASEALRAEERLAWQRLMRVLSHEINNSLAPIKSIVRTLRRILITSDVPLQQDEDFQHGLEVIGDRAEALNRFIQSYAQIAKLPPPTRKKVRVQSIVDRVVHLEKAELPVHIIAGPDIEISLDRDQIEQALINLLRNAIDAVLLNTGAAPTPEAVTLLWNVAGSTLQILILDEGVGLADTDNLFVPFFTTKEHGSGIGLLLSRQIIEAHGGTLTLQNRTDSTGCEVVITLAINGVEAV